MIAIKTTFTEKDYEYLKNEVFLYLEELRKSGETNMFGAASYIENDFEVDKNIARRFLSEWMKTYNKKDKEQ
tara:strand:- start:365 stop:580 length:216 start_codon:yes stop_codon:yes gene_type:complete